MNPQITTDARRLPRVALHCVPSPAPVIVWAWLRLIVKHKSDPSISFRSPTVIFLFLMTVSYGLDFSTMLIKTLQRYSDEWHGKDVGIYFLVSFLACVFSAVGKSPIRRQVFSAGALLAILYFWALRKLWALWALMD